MLDTSQCVAQRATVVLLMVVVVLVVLVVVVVVVVVVVLVVVQIVAFASFARCAIFCAQCCGFAANRICIILINFKHKYTKKYNYINDTT
jgi:hypothetical protein